MKVLIIDSRADAAMCRRIRDELMRALSFGPITCIRQLGGSHQRFDLCLAQSVDRLFALIGPHELVRNLRIYIIFCQILRSGEISSKA
jgi:hypothetical protein